MLAELLMSPARITAAVAVFAVSASSAWISFSHLRALGMSHGYSDLTSIPLAISTDGLIVASSMTLLTSAERQLLARAGLVLGVVASVAANVLAGAPYGLVGMIAGAWPAIAFILSSEIMLKMIRREAHTPQHISETVDDVTVVPTQTAPEDGGSVVIPAVEPVYTAPVAVSDTVAATVPGGVPDEYAAFSDHIAAGRLPGLRETMKLASCGQPRAREIRADLREVLQAQPV